MPKPRKKEKAMPQVADDPNIGTLTVLNPDRIRVPDLRVVRKELRYDADNIEAKRNLRDDPLARLHDRGQITNAMFFAGRHWQKLYEDSQVGRIGSSGDLKEPVDGTPPTRDPITDKQVKASHELARIDASLGKVGSILVRDILGDGLTIVQMCKRHGIDPTAREADRWGKRFRECLSTISEELGYGRGDS